MPRPSLFQWLVVVVLSISPGRAAAADADWWRTKLVGMEIGPTGAQFGYSDTNDARYAARFDGREIVRSAAAAHSEYVVFWARDGDFAYYDSKLLPKAPGLGSRDPLREAVEEAGAKRLPLIAYCVVQQGGNYLKAHPEFEMRGADGRTLGRFCYNSGYLEVMKGILSEQLAYGIDGFHIDMLDQGFGAPYGCWCDACKERFESRFKRPMPKGPTWDDDWDHMLEFRYASSARFERELFTHVKAVNPKATVDFNYHGNPPFSFEVGQLPVRHAVNADFVTGETGMWGFSALTVGLNAAFYRAATPGRRVQVAISRDARTYHNQTVRPAEDIRWELLTLLAHGAFVTCVDKTAFDGSLDPVAYDHVGVAFADALARRKHFGQPVSAEVGVYFSSRTRDWAGRDHPGDYFQSFLGAHKALVYEHIPWDVVLDENADLALLRRHPVILVPGASILSEREVGMFRDYVSLGGHLIFTGWSGTLDAKGKPLAHGALDELIGARFASRLDTLDNWVRLPAPAPAGPNLLAPDGRPDRPILVKGPASIYEPGEATPIGELMKPSRTLRQKQGREGTEWPMSADAAVGPAAFVHPVGRGTVFTFAASPDASTGGEHHVPEARRLLANAVRFLNPHPRVAITAPANVETVVTDDPAARTLRIHFIGYNAPAQTMAARNRPYVLPALIEDAPIFRASVTFADKPARVAAFNKSTQVRRNGRTVDLLVEDVHDVLVVEY
jgi:Hypothetical glycosyl hydrolase 6/Beta-galactosidase trimerisation domain